MPPGGKDERNVGRTINLTTRPHRKVRLALFCSNVEAASANGPWEH